MQRQRRLAQVFGVALMTLLFLTPPVHSKGIAEDQQKALESSKYVYIQSSRKDGSLGAAAEIWFLYHDGAVWVCTPASTHRVKRIQAGQTKAKIAIGTPNGPSFMATGSLVKDPAVNEVLFETFAKKYSDSWASYEKGFKEGLADGSRMLVKYEAE
jgi:hypothetical protein